MLPNHLINSDFIFNKMYSLNFSNLGKPPNKLENDSIKIYNSSIVKYLQTARLIISPLHCASLSTFL